MVCTTPPHGSKSPQKADWSPLEGRTVVIWPDHDEVGIEFAEAVLRLASEAGATDVRVVDVNTNLIVVATTVHGKLTQQYANSLFGVAGVSVSQSEFSKSVLGQATRVALVAAVKTIHERLRQRHTATSAIPTHPIAPAVQPVVQSVTR